MHIKKLILVLKSNNCSTSNHNNNLKTGKSRSSNEESWKQISLIQATQEALTRKEQNQFVYIFGFVVLKLFLTLSIAFLVADITVMAVEAMNMS